MSIISWKGPVECIVCSRTQRELWIGKLWRAGWYPTAQNAGCYAVERGWIAARPAQSLQNSPHNALIDLLEFHLAVQLCNSLLKSFTNKHVTDTGQAFSTHCLFWKGLRSTRLWFAVASAASYDAFTRNPPTLWVSASVRQGQRSEERFSPFSISANRHLQTSPTSYWCIDNTLCSLMCSSPWMMSNMNLVSLVHIYFTCVVQRAIPGICHYFSPNQKRKIKLLKFSCIFTKICKGFTKFQNLSPDDKKCLQKHCWWCWRGICVKFGPNHCIIYDFKRPAHEHCPNDHTSNCSLNNCLCDHLDLCRGFFQNQPTESWNQPTEQEIQRQLSSVSVFQCFCGSRTRKSVSSRSFWYNKLFLQLHTCKITTSPRTFNLHCFSGNFWS